MSLIVASLKTKTIYADRALTGDGVKFCSYVKAFRSSHGVFGLVGVASKIASFSASILACRGGPIDKFGRFRFDASEYLEPEVSGFGFFDIGVDKGVPVYLAGGSAVLVSETRIWRDSRDNFIFFGNMEHYARGYLDCHGSAPSDQREEKDIMSRMFWACSLSTSSVSAEFDVMSYNG